LLKCDDDKLISCRWRDHGEHSGSARCVVLKLLGVEL
jgi:hypothetical protein